MHLLLYDGECGVCSRAVQFVLRHDTGEKFRFAALQSAAGRAFVRQSGGTPDDPGTFYVVANYRAVDPRPLTRGDAVLFLCGELGWPWRVALLGRMVPRVLRDRAYDFVARRRHRLLPGGEQCLLPTPDQRHRFLDRDQER